MAMRYRERVWQLAAPATLAVSVAEVKSHAHVFHDEDDSLISGYIAAAVDVVEMQTQRALVVRQGILRLPEVPQGRAPIELPGGRVASVASVVIDGTSLTGTDYEVIGDSPAQMIPADDWPVIMSDDGLPVTMTYSVGYVAIPAALKVAVSMIAAELFRQRFVSVDGTLAAVPYAADVLMRPFRIFAL